MTNIVTVPLRSNIFFYTFTISLSGIIYTFTLRYNGRMDRWILNIDDVAGNQIISGIVLLINRDFMSFYPTLNTIKGTLLVIDVTGQGNNPTQFTFSTNNFLVYVA